MYSERSKYSNIEKRRGEKRKEGRENRKTLEFTLIQGCLVLIQLEIEFNRKATNNVTVY